jgi:hypothetical protein
LDLYVLFLRDVEDPDVGDGAAGHAAGDFLAYKEIGMPHEQFGALDRIVIGQREKASSHTRSAAHTLAAAGYNFHGKSRK